MATVFTAEERDRVREFVLETARADDRIVAAAVVGSFARGAADRWSDLDLTFAVRDAAAVPEVLRDWSGEMAARFEAAEVLDLRVGPTIYRVFMLPGLLQVDLSFTPAASFAPVKSAFQLLFGEAGELTPRPARSAADIFGWSALHALHAWKCVARDRPMQALYHVTGAREHALLLACLRRGLVPDEPSWDELPAELRAAAERTLVHSLERNDLLAALRAAVELLAGEAADVDAAPLIVADLRALLETPLPRRAAHEQSRAAP